MLTPSAPSGVTFNWYDVASNGNLLFSGSTFTTPTLNSNTTYYVESENGSGCKSTRTSVTVTIDAAPSSPTVIGTSICSGQTAMLTPSAPSGVTFNWYDAASNGNLLFSGSTFTTPTLNSNTTYYVESENGSGCKSTRTSVTVTIDAAPLKSNSQWHEYLQWTNGYAYTKCSIRCYVQLVRCCIEWQFAF
ncbi:MAG: hypothetical protein IPH74_11750 [Bacteroidetes bacterium]|nr:hypothetical protein [Bacteroidota bacterium]